MLGIPVLAATLAVLAPSQVCFVETEGRVVACHPLTGSGAAVFATPDRRALVPLRDADATVVVALDGTVERWPGRLFPLFFDEPGKMYVLLPGELVTLSFPERLELRRTRLPGVERASYAACSPEGQVVAVVSGAGGASSLTLVAAREGKARAGEALPAPVSRVAVLPQGRSLLLGLATGRLEAFSAQVGPLPGALELDGAVTAVAVREDARGAVIGVASQAGGSLVGVKLKGSSAHPLKELFRVDVAAPVRSLVFAGEELCALVGESVQVRDRAGRRLLGEIAVAGAEQMVSLPARAGLAVPEWHEE